MSDAPPPVNRIRQYWPSPSERTDAKKLCTCGSPVQNYDQYMRQKRATLVGCCCSASTCTLANIYSPELCDTIFSAPSIYFGIANDKSDITFIADPITIDGDFTVEWFQYLTGDYLYPRIFSELPPFPFLTDNYFACSIEGGIFLFFLGNTYAFGGFNSYTDLKNKWVHFAIIRNGGILRAFMNGEQLPTTFTENGTVSLSQFMIGNIWNNTTDTQFIGYISSFRFVNGVAVYTTPFQKPITPRKDIPGTQILLLAKTASTVSENSASAQLPSSTQPSGTITWSPAF
jgi:hypothetical protein